MPPDTGRPPVSLLYAVIFLSWSGAWFAMKLQTADVAPLVAVALRFLIAAPLALGIAWLQRAPLSFGLADQLRFAAIGATMFSTNFIFAYHASIHLTSALVSAIFSLTAACNLLLSWLFFRRRPTGADAFGAAAGSLGLGLLMWTEVAGTGPGGQPGLGIALALGMTLSFSLGNMASFSVQRRGISMVPATAWAMAWGGALTTAVALASGQSWQIPLSAPYLGSLAFLVCAGTVTAFLAYGALIARAGAFRAASLNLAVPTGAFVISTLFEGYDWSVMTLAGLGLAIAGNYLILSRQRRRTPD